VIPLQVALAACEVEELIFMKESTSFRSRAIGAASRWMMCLRRWLAWCGQSLS
jgi:hypothetical protein